MDSTDSYFTSIRDVNKDIDRVSAELRIYSGSLHPSRVTEILRLRPTRSVAEGERSRAISRGVTSLEKINGWFLSSEEHVQSKDIRPHLDWLLAELEKGREGIRVLQKTAGIRMYLVCIIWTNNGGGAISIWPKQLEAMAELNLEFTIDFTDYGEPDVPTGAKALT